LATVLGFSAPPAAAQVTPGDPAGNQTIPEKDQSRTQDMPKGEKDGDKTLSNKLNASTLACKSDTNVIAKEIAVGV
jgi:hypothetical protein